MSEEIENIKISDVANGIKEGTVSSVIIRGQEAFITYTDETRKEG